MKFGYINNGEPIEVVSEAVIDGVAHSRATLALWSEEERAAIGVTTILPPAPPPEGQRLAGTVLTIVDGVLHDVGVYEDIPPPPVPTKVHKYWLVEVLIQQGRMSNLRTILAANEEANDRWNASSDVYRNNPLVDWFAAVEQLTAAEIDAMFIQAAAYQAAHGG